MTKLLLSESAKVRYATGSMMYFAQGIPYGLLSIAVPAWLASQGVSAADIGTYLAVVILPWAFKLVTGPLMDRYQFPSMGRRRPWVLGAQLGLTLSLLALALVGGAMTLGGCKEEGTMEKAGKKADDAAEKAGEKMEDAAGEAGKALEDMGN